MVKGLMRVLGTVKGYAKKEGPYGVIGRITMWGDTKSTAIRIGKLGNNGDWEELPESGLIVLAPDEREELIEVLESHRDFMVIKIGDKVGRNDAVVLAVQYVNATGNGGRLLGTVLAWDNYKREYVVLTADPYGNVENGTYTPDQQRALNAYSTRAVDHLYPHFNASPPTLTFAHVTERDKLKPNT